MTKFIFTKDSIIPSSPRPLLGLASQNVLFKKGQMVSGYINGTTSHYGTSNGFAYFSDHGRDFVVSLSTGTPLEIVKVKNISSKAIEYSSNIEGNKIGKYRFKTDYKTYPYYPEGVQPITAGILKEFKKGDVIEGSFFNDNSQSERDYVLINGGYRIPFGGRVSPIEQIITADLPQRQVDSTKSVLKEKSNSVFTTKNLVISLAVAGLLYGIYTIYKK